MIEDIESVERIELYHPDKPIYIHIEFIRNQPVQTRKLYWNKVVITDQWMCTTVYHAVPIYSRTTWNDGAQQGVMYGEKWDHPISSIDAKLAAYQRSGYQIAAVRRYE